SEKGVTSIILARSNRKPGRKTVPDQVSLGHGTSATLWNEARTQLIEYLAGERRAFSLPVDMSGGTPFQRLVWRAILRIPHGRVRSYQWVAARVGGKQYARAVGMALGSNPVPIVVPCHRIIAHDGSLGGFAGGLPMKRRLLKLEGTLSQLQNGK
ncbi:MAG: methylated-DNA--[protein]-cysteine S-methyltransferase, partial [Nitrospiraceae bacterium]